MLKHNKNEFRVAIYANNNWTFENYKIDYTTIEDITHVNKIPVIDCGNFVLIYTTKNNPYCIKFDHRISQMVSVSTTLVVMTNEFLHFITNNIVVNKIKYKKHNNPDAKYVIDKFGDHIKLTFKLDLSQNHFKFMTRWVS